MPRGRSSASRPSGRPPSEVSGAGSGGGTVIGQRLPVGRREGVSAAKLTPTSVSTWSRQSARRGGSRRGAVHGASAAADAVGDPGPSPVPGLPTTERGRRMRARLLAAAREVFERDGFLDARVTDISAAAGVAHGSFY